MIENEKKILLTADEYYTIVMSMCKHSTVKTQTNYYFDTDTFSMNQKGITCRIRAKDGKFLATVKSHNIKQPDSSIEMNLVEKTYFDANVFNSFGMRHQGELVTERIVMFKDSFCELVLDRNTYLGQVDFELEVEYCEGSERRAQMLLECIAAQLVSTGSLTDVAEFLERVGLSKSKSQRFFDKKCERRR